MYVQTNATHCFIVFAALLCTPQSWLNTILNCISIYYCSWKIMFYHLKVSLCFFFLACLFLEFAKISGKLSLMRQTKRRTSDQWYELSRQFFNHNLHLIVIYAGNLITERTTNYVIPLYCTKNIKCIDECIWFCYLCNLYP